MRLDKFLADMNQGTRKELKQLIRKGLVTVDGVTVKDPGTAVTKTSDIVLAGIPVVYNEYEYYMMNKPRGVITATEDARQETVLDLMVGKHRKDISPVGRLDKDSEGLLLMTNDGAFAQAVTHPSGGISKLYRVTVQPRADESQILKLSSGVVLDDGTKTMPCAINVVTDEPGRTVMEMTLKEGKNREIRRMCEAVGLEVVRLKRNAEGVVKLGMLKPGTYRELTKAEINGLRSAAAKGRAQTRSAALQSKAAERRPRGPVGKSAPKKRK